MLWCGHPRRRNGAMVGSARQTTSRWVQQYDAKRPHVAALAEAWWKGARHAGALRVGPMPMNVSFCSTRSERLPGTLRGCSCSPVRRSGDREPASVDDGHRHACQDQPTGVVFHRRTRRARRARSSAGASLRPQQPVGELAWDRPVLVVEQLVQLRGLIAVEPGQKAITRLIDLTMINACRGATDELQRAAFSDPLTGCSNRRAFERDLDRELARCARAELDLSVVAIDLDGLKAVNDTAGHAGRRQATGAPRRHLAKGSPQHGRHLPSRWGRVRSRAAGHLAGRRGRSHRPGGAHGCPVRSVGAPRIANRRDTVMSR